MSKAPVVEEVREMVFREFVRHARPNKRVADAVQDIGMFTFMDIVDQIIDALLVALPDLCDVSVRELQAQDVARQEVAEQLRTLADRYAPEPTP